MTNGRHGFRGRPEDQNPHFVVAFSSEPFMFSRVQIAPTRPKAKDRGAAVAGSQAQLTGETRSTASSSLVKVGQGGSGLIQAEGKTSKMAPATRKQAQAGWRCGRRGRCMPKQRLRRIGVNWGELSQIKAGTNAKAGRHQRTGDRAAIKVDQAGSKWIKPKHIPPAGAGTVVLRARPGGGGQRTTMKMNDLETR